MGFAFNQKRCPSSLFLMGKPSISKQPKRTWLRLPVLTKSKAAGINAAMPGRTGCKPESSPFPYEHPSPCQRIVISLLPLDLKYDVKKKRGDVRQSSYFKRIKEQLFLKKKMKKDKICVSWELFLGQKHPQSSGS